MNTGEKIKSIAKSKGIKLTAIAGDLGISRQAFDFMLKAKSMKIDNIHKIATFLNVPVSVFFDVDKDNEIEKFKNIFNSKDYEIPSFEELEKSVTDSKSKGGIEQAIIALAGATSLFPLTSREILRIMERIEKDENYSKDDIYKDLKELMYKVSKLANE